MKMGVEHRDTQSRDGASSGTGNSVYAAGTPWFYPMVAAASIGLAIVCLILGFCWLSGSDPHLRKKSILYVAWVVGPPIWFFLEFFYFRKHGKPECFETFKYGQDLAGKVWLALAAILGALFFGKDLFKG